MIDITFAGEEGQGSVATVAIQRAEKRNALTVELLNALADIHTRAELDNGHVHAIVLSGDGPTFCAGFDLSLCKDDPSMMGQLLTSLSAAVRAFRACPVPVIAAAQGAAIAGGCALLAGCDLVVTDRNAKLGYPVVRLGVSPAISSSTLRLAVGDSHTRERLLDPGLITGEEAHRIGLATHLVESPDQVLAEAFQIADIVRQKPPHAVAATKRWCNELDGSDNINNHEAALQASLALAGGEEEQERLAELWKN